MDMVSIITVWVLLLFTAIGAYCAYFAMTMAPDEKDRLVGFQRFLYYAGVAFVVGIFVAFVGGLSVVVAYAIVRIAVGN